MTFAPLLRFSFENYSIMIALVFIFVNTFLQKYAKLCNQDIRCLIKNSDFSGLKMLRECIIICVQNLLCGCSLSVEHQLPKLSRRVRLPSSAPSKKSDLSTRHSLFFARCVPLPRNVMYTSCVMFASQVMCTSRVKEAERISSLCGNAAILLIAFAACDKFIT